MRPCLLQWVSGAHIGHQIACCENPPDIGACDLAAVRAQDRRAGSNSFRSKGDVIGNNNVIGLASFRNPYIGSVRTVIHNPQLDQRMRIWPDTAIADHDSAASVADRNRYNFILHRTGISINIDHHDPRQ